MKRFRPSFNPEPLGRFRSDSYSSKRVLLYCFMSGSIRETVEIISQFGIWMELTFRREE